MMRQITFEVYLLALREVFGAFKRGYGGTLASLPRIKPSQVRKRAKREMRDSLISKTGKTGSKQRFSRCFDAAGFLLGPVGAEMLLFYSCYPDSRDMVRDLCRSVVEEDDVYMQPWKEKWELLRELLINTKQRQACVEAWELHHARIRVQAQAAPRV